MHKLARLQATVSRTRGLLLARESQVSPRQDLAQLEQQQRAVHSWGSGRRCHLSGVGGGSARGLPAEPVPRWCDERQGSGGAAAQAAVSGPVSPDIRAGPLSRCSEARFL